MRYFLMNYTSPSGHDYEVEKMARKFSRTIAERYDDIVLIANALLEKAKMINPESKLDFFKAKAGCFNIRINDDIMIDMLFYEIKEQSDGQKLTFTNNEKGGLA